jgi:hypothetical protein
MSALTEQKGWSFSPNCHIKGVFKYFPRYFRSSNVPAGVLFLDQE